MNIWPEAISIIKKKLDQMMMLRSIISLGDRSLTSVKIICKSINLLSIK